MTKPKGSYWKILYVISPYYIKRNVVVHPSSLLNVSWWWMLSRQRTSSNYHLLGWTPFHLQNDPQSRSCCAPLVPCSYRWKAGQGWTPCSWYPRGAGTSPWRGLHLFGLRQSDRRWQCPPSDLPDHQHDPGRVAHCKEEEDKDSSWRFLTSTLCWLFL